MIYIFAISNPKLCNILLLQTLQCCIAMRLGLILMVLAGIGNVFFSLKETLPASERLLRYASTGYAIICVGIRSNTTKPLIVP